METVITSATVAIAAVREVSVQTVMTWATDVIAAVRDAQVQTVMAWATVVNAAAAVFYVILTSLVIRKMTEQERSRIRPYVSVYAELRDYNLFVILRNFGETPAFGLTLTPRSDSPSPFWKDRDIAVIKEPIAMLAAHQEIAEYLSSTSEVQKDAQTSDSFAFSCTVSYTDQEGHAYGPEPAVIDLSIYKRLPLSNMPATFENISDKRSLESMASSLTSVEGALNEIKKDINSYLQGLRFSAQSRPC